MYSSRASSASDSAKRFIVAGSRMISRVSSRDSSTYGAMQMAEGLPCTVVDKSMTEIVPRQGKHCLPYTDPAGFRPGRAGDCQPLVAVSGYPFPLGGNHVSRCPR